MTVLEWDMGMQGKPEDFVTFRLPDRVRRLIVVRHGQYQGSRENEQLTEVGKEQIVALASRIKNLLPDWGVVLNCTSPEPRAEETAWILSGELGLGGICLKESLSTEGQTHSTEFPVTMEMVAIYGAQCDTLIMVSQAGIACGFLQAYAREVLGVDLGNFRLVHKGSAVMLELDSETPSIKPL